MTATAPAPSPARAARATARLPRLVLVLAALLATLFAAAAPASAHAALTASDPKDGAVVATAPAQVTLSFSEQVAMGDDSIRVMDPAGKRVDTGELRDMCSGSTIRYGTALHSGLPDGTYTVAWQAVSADSHPVSGAFTFSIGAPSATSVALPDQQAGGGPVGIAYGIARYAAYAGFTVLVGGGAFILLCWRRGAAERSLQKLVVRGWVTLTAATLAMLVLRTPYTGSGKFADAFDLDGLRAVLDTKTGASFVSRLLLLGAAALFIAVLFGAYARRQKASGTEGAGGTGVCADAPADVSGDVSAADAAKEAKEETSDLGFGLAIGGTVVAGGIAATWALAEHASTGIQPGIAMPVDVLHLLAVAAWLGGLVALLVALHKVPDIEREAVRRFSRVAFISVLVLAEAGVAVVLLAVTTVLTSTEPGRAAEQETGRSSSAGPAVPNRAVKITLPFDTGGQNGKGSVRLELDPGRVGANTLHLWADGADGKPLDLPEIKISFTLEAKEIGPLPVAPDRDAPGHWSATGVQLPLAGDWRIDVTVRTSDIDQTTVQKNVKIG
ncbi:copper resistance CopC/CopD family protein [Streptomyces sp. NPDC059982]|uniref:copper resistance CopC/CopD family protein n=2 Tax=unclassified Streptomyces TaxID=2593676 RepID=UPI003678BB01